MTFGLTPHKFVAVTQDPSQASREGRIARVNPICHTSMMISLPLRNAVRREVWSGRQPPKRETEMGCLSLSVSSSSLASVCVSVCHTSAVRREVWSGRQLPNREGEVRCLSLSVCLSVYLFIILIIICLFVIRPRCVENPAAGGSRRSAKVKLALATEDPSPASREGRSAWPAKPQPARAAPPAGCTVHEMTGKRINGCQAYM